MNTIYFNGTYDNIAYANCIVMPRQPNHLYYCGTINVVDGQPQLAMNLGDYIMITWVPNGIAKFTRHGKYGGVNLMDNVRADDLKIQLFQHAVGHSLAPSSIEDSGESDVVAEPSYSDEYKPVTLASLKKGEYFKLKASDKAPVWIRDDYYRSEGKFGIFKADDVNHETLRKGQSVVFVGFTY